ncbi:hypothetical protein [Kallotenue papyrolyticum]|uniref:NADH-quinone oxidoreductase subunit D-related protein n=1 Tax=Kallotenue papyrolyticum TaxID=1325125 RepID=UPI000492B991|nr:hypothetical protein [Kallotenue papyrolyticum]
MSYILPLGPFHPALRVPQRFELRVEGEKIIDVDYRGGYTDRAVIERLRRADLLRSAILVSRFCGAHAQHHALAWTMALEALGNIPVPPRAASLRSVAAELERATAHLHQAALVFELLGLGQARRQIVALREWILAAALRLSGRRLGAEYIRPGGVASDLDEDNRAAILRLVEQPAEALYRLIDRTVRRRHLVRRLVGIGRLTLEAAERLGVSGPLGRAAGIARDLRLEAPYAAYAGAPPAQVIQPSGDAYARLMVLLLEAYDSLQLVQRLLRSLPGGPCVGEPVAALPPGTSTAGVEAPGGPLHYALRSDGTRLTEIRVETPGAPQRLTWRALLAGQLVEDAAIIIAGVAACPTCAEVAS